MWQPQSGQWAQARGMHCATRLVRTGCAHHLNWGSCCCVPVPLLLIGDSSRQSTVLSRRYAFGLCLRGLPAPAPAPAGGVGPEGAAGPSTAWRAAAPRPPLHASMHKVQVSLKPTHAAGVAPIPPPLPSPPPPGPGRPTTST